MEKKWSNAWTGSKAPRKQRKYRYNAPLHVRQKFMHVNLSPELRKKYGKRQIMVRKGDKVVVTRGQHRKKTGVVSRVMLKLDKVYVEGITNPKRDGATSMVGLKASNLMITSLQLDDKKRKAKLGEASKEKK